MRTARSVPLVGILAISLQTAPLPAMGEESFGNEPMAMQDDWSEGTLPVVNDPHRVYRFWVNGNESFFFSGDTAALNAALERFAAMKSPGKHVRILPTEGIATSFDGKKKAAYEWEVHVPSGIYLGQAKREKGTNVFALHPSLTICAGSAKVDLRALRIPAGLPVSGTDDEVRKALDGLRSGDGTVRGQAAFRLGELGDFGDVVGPLEKALADPDAYVKRCAAAGLGRLGKRAAAAIPALRECAKGADANVRQSCEKAIEEIGKAPPVDQERARRLAKAAEAIKAFLAAREGGKAAPKQAGR